MRNRAGFTIMEIMMAVAMATFMAAIGFTGIQAFGKSITRSKQFTSESEMIIACMRMAIGQAEAGYSQISATPGVLPVPRNWTQCKISGNTITFTLDTNLKLVSTGGSDGSIGTSSIFGGLNMNAAHENTLTVKTLASKL
jgi:Tfp pilus assembly protein FimT